jgi:hypothetical protein
LRESIRTTGRTWLVAFSRLRPRTVLHPTRAPSAQQHKPNGPMKRGTSGIAFARCATTISSGHGCGALPDDVFSWPYPVAAGAWLAGHGWCAVVR